MVLTRDAELCGEYAAAFAPVDVVAMPVTRTEPPSDPDALGRALERGVVAAVMVASARAAAAVVASRWSRRAPIYAIGPATARVFEAAGMACIVPDGVRDATTLARATIAHLTNLTNLTPSPVVVVPRAEEGRDEGIAVLRAAGVTVDDVVAYRTVPTAADDPALDAGRAALADAVACAVFAPSQVAALDALVGIAALRCPLLAIGETTAAALRAAGARTVGIADSPTPEGLARALAAVQERSR